MSTFRKWVLAIGLFIALVVDGVCALYLHQFMTYDNFAASSVILPISVMLIGLFDDTNDNEIWLALGAGIVADSVGESEYEECCNKVMALAKTLVSEERL